jgi:hypothetical protein
MAESSEVRRLRLDRSVLLQEASVQEIQLELIRRTKFNDMDGEHIARALVQHRDLWSAVLLDRQPYWSKDFRQLPSSWLIKMRDMPHNIWNADTLFLVTDSPQKARQLADIATGGDHWGGEVIVHEDREETDRALGAGRHSYSIVTVWWD